MDDDISIRLVDTDEDLMDVLLLRFRDDLETLGGSYKLDFSDFGSVDINSQKNSFLLAKKGEVPIGYASGYRAKHLVNTYWSEGVYVVPEFRNKGIGYALKKAQIDFARKNSFDYTKSAVFKTNSSSIRVLQKLGFSFESKSDWYSVTLCLKEELNQDS